VWIAAAVAAGLALLALSPLPLARVVEERLATAVGVPAGALRDATRPAADLLLRAGQLRELSAENAELRRRLAAAESDLASRRERQIAVDQARALLDAAGPEAVGVVTARVVVRDPAPGRQGVLIDRGARDGVHIGQPVLTSGATLAGIVIEVGAHRSRVRLLTDPDSAVAAVVQSSRTPAAAAGTGAGLRLDYVPRGAPLIKGDLVVSSPIGGRLPAGLLIGRVSSIDARQEDLFERVTAEPLADFLRLEQVLVMTGFQPAGAVSLEGTSR